MMNKLGRMRRIDGRCFLCGESKKLTDEEVWPRWVRKYIIVRPHNAFESAHGATEGFGATRPLSLVKKPKYRPGNILSRRAHTVCRDCNGGWMSQLEQKSESIVSRIILGQWRSLDAAGQRTLAVWIALRTLVIQSLDPIRTAISADQRRQFSQTQEPPKGWLFWIGSFSGTGPRFGEFGYSEVRLTWPEVEEAPTPGAEPNRMTNTHVASAAIGRLLFRCAGSGQYDLGIFGVDDIAQVRGFARIWPTMSDPLTRPTHEFTDANMITTRNPHPFEEEHLDFIARWREPPPAPLAIPGI